MKYLLWILTFAALAPTAAQAAGHTVEGCMSVIDTRPSSTTLGQYIPLRGVAVRVRADRGLAGWHTVAQDVTDGSGCFRATPSRWWIDEHETYEVEYEMEDADLRVSPGSGTYSFASQQLTATGANALVGPFAVMISSIHPGQPVCMVWETAHDIIDRYNAALYTPWSYPQLKFVWPEEAQAANYRLNRIGVLEWESDEMSVFAHEMAHHIDEHDATGFLATDYCAGMSNGAFPYLDAPYFTKDAMYLGTFDECVHNFETFEYEEEATSEAHAEFIAEILVPEEPHAELAEERPLNFDGPHREGNAAGLLLDLWDTGPEENTWLHTWLPQGAMTPLELSGLDSTTRGGAVDGNMAWLWSTQVVAAPSPVTAGHLYAVDLQTGSQTQTLMTYGSPSRVTAHGGVVCLLLDSILCQGGGVGNAVQVPGPADAAEIVDLELSSWGLFVLGEHAASGGDAVWWRDSNGQWVELLDWPVLASADSNLPSPAKALAIRESDHRVFVARQNSVFECAVWQCTAPLRVAGDGRFGDDRGHAARFAFIEDLTAAAGDLFVSDFYGVARIDLQGVSRRTEQLLGWRGEPIFENRWSPRALHVSEGGGFAAIGDTLSLLGGAVGRLELDRLGEQSAHVAYLVETDAPSTDELYCGAEDVSLDLDTLVHAYRGLPRSSTLSDLLDNMAGLSPSERIGVEEINWIRLNSACTWPEGAPPIAPFDDDVFSSVPSEEPPTAPFDEDVLDSPLPPEPPHAVFGDDALSPPPPPPHCADPSEAALPQPAPLRPETLAMLGPDLCQGGGADCSVILLEAGPRPELAPSATAAPTCGGVSSPDEAEVDEGGVHRFPWQAD